MTYTFFKQNEPTYMEFFNSYFIKKYETFIKNEHIFIKAYKLFKDHEIIRSYLISFFWEHANKNEIFNTEEIKDEILNLFNQVNNLLDKQQQSISFRYNYNVIKLFSETKKSPSHLHLFDTKGWLSTL